jgi:hypothetical protein
MVAAPSSWSPIGKQCAGNRHPDSDREVGLWSESQFARRPSIERPFRKSGWACYTARGTGDAVGRPAFRSPLSLRLRPGCQAKRGSADTRTPPRRLRYAQALRVSPDVAAPCRCLRRTANIQRVCATLCGVGGSHPLDCCAGYGKARPQGELGIAGRVAVARFLTSRLLPTLHGTGRTAYC